MMTDDVVVDVSQDWILACNVQQRFMQGSGQNNGSTTLSGRCRQVRALGGDCYDFIRLTDHLVAVVIGDASGKGLAAALMIASVQASLRTAALFTGSDLAALLKVVNHEAYASSHTDRYATLFYGVYDSQARTLRYVNAGHNPPAVLRQDGSAHWLEPTGAPVGIFPDTHYQERFLQLHPGDLVIAYTDGVVEATNPGEEEWGVQGLLKTAAACGPQCRKDADEMVQVIFNSMDDFSEGCQTDDATLAVLRVV